jgi:sugar phosphate isomerase/epimerase
MKKPISVQLYSVRDAAAKDFPATLKKIADMGYVGVEFAGLHGHSAQDIAKLIKNLGMVASSAHVGMPSKENINQLVEEAKTLGYKYLITGFGPDDMKTADSVKACAEKFASATTLVKPHGLTLGMHNHWWEFDRQFDGKTPYEIIMNTAPDLASELDIYWSTKGGADTVKVVKTWAKRIPLLHVKDGDLTEKIVHKAVGEGKVKIKPIVTTADPKSLQWLIVELDNCDTDMLEAVEKSYKWLVANGLAEGRK